MSLAGLPLFDGLDAAPALPSFHLDDLGFEAVNYMSREPKRLADAVRRRGLEADDDLAYHLENHCDYKSDGWRPVFGPTLEARMAPGDAELLALFDSFLFETLPSTLQRMSRALAAINAEAPHE